MRKIAAVIYFLFLTAILHAQVPGYMGKKFSAGYDLHFYLGGIDQDARKYDPTYHLYQPSLFFNNFHEVHADYVLSKNYSLGLTYQFFKTGQYYYMDGHYPGLSFESDNYLNITGSAIIINNKFFFFNNGTGLAPIGNYGQLGIGMIRGKSIDKETGTQYDDFGTTHISRIVSRTNVTTPILSAGLGNQSILFDRIIIDAGVELAFLPGAVKGWVHGDSNTNYLTLASDEEANAKNAILTRLQTFYVSSVKVGIGILLF